MAHIVLIEPDRLLAETYQRILVADGHHVVPCASAQAAILAADQTAPDAVLLELQLTGHSGLEFLYEFRSYGEWQDVPVIIHSQVPPAEFAGSRDLLAEQLGVRQYLYKPRTTLVRLRSSVRAALELAAAA